MNTIGENIRKARKALGMSQDELADEIGANRVTISKYENGVYLPSVTALERLSSALGTTPSRLSGNKNDENADYLLTEEKHLLHLFRNLTDEGKAEAFKYLLLLQHEYTQEK